MLAGVSVLWCEVLVGRLPYIAMTAIFEPFPVVATPVGPDHQTTASHLVTCPLSSIPARNQGRSVCGRAVPSNSVQGKLWDS